MKCEQCTEKKSFYDGIEQGRADMKQEIIDIIRPCLSRDVTLQKIITVIEELK